MIHLIDNMDLVEEAYSIKYQCPSCEGPNRQDRWNGLCDEVATEEGKYTLAEVEEELKINPDNLLYLSLKSIMIFEKVTELFLTGDLD